MSSATSSTGLNESTPRSNSPSPRPVPAVPRPYLRVLRLGVRTSGPNSFGRKNAARRHASGTARHASAAGKSASAFEPTTAWMGKECGIGSVASFEPTGTDDDTEFAPREFKTPPFKELFPSKVASPNVDGIGSDTARTSGTLAGSAGLNGESKLPSSFSRYDVYIRKPSSAAAATVAQVATSPPPAWSSASGSNSARVIHTMHPAANPMAKGSSAWNVSTKTKAGTATRGWGMDVRMDHAAHFQGETPRAASTVATAMPSGMLWTPMAKVMSWPCAHPLAPLKDTPTPDPSPRACAAMIPTMSRVFRASAPRSISNLTSSAPCSHPCMMEMNTAPAHTPHTT
mmetsp:Transcript_6449/g.24995  ORF Transcript_6449/g.24995 Transcript_6449/m.24995 type:complete len:343 (-) Transcript_6449:1733-2761(-)